MTVSIHDLMPVTVFTTSEECFKIVNLGLLLRRNSHSSRGSGEDSLAHCLYEADTVPGCEASQDISLGEG